MALTPVVSVVPVLWSRVGNTEEVIDTAAEAEAEMEEEKKLDSISVKVVGQVKKRRDEGLFLQNCFPFHYCVLFRIPVKFCSVSREIPP